MVSTDEGLYLLERIESLDETIKDVQESLQFIQTTQMDHQTRISLVELNLSLLRTIHQQVEEIKTTLNRMNGEVVETKTRLNIYVAVICGAGAALGAVLTMAPKLLPVLIALF